MKNHKIETIVVPVLLWLIAVVVILTGLRPFASGDVTTELWRVQNTIDYGWNITAIDHNNASITLNVIIPFISKTLSLTPLSVFRDIMPLIFALTPVLLYFLCRWVMSSGRALLAALFFIVLPPTYQEVPNITKSMLAEPLAVGTMLVAFGNYGKSSLRLSASGVMAVLVVAAHYTVGVLLVMWLGISALVGKNKRLIVGYILTSIIALTYLSIAGGGIIVTSLLNWNQLDDHKNDVVYKALMWQKFLPYSMQKPTPNGAVGETPKVLRELNIYHPLSIPISIPYWVRTIAIYLGILFLAAGGAYTILHQEYIKRHKNLAAIVIFSTALVLLAMFIPFFTKGLFISRWIQLASLPTCGLFGIATYWFSRKYSYPVAVLVLLSILVLVR